MAACGPLSSFGPTEPQLPVTAGLPVDPVFKEFYQTLGGQSILGSVLTGLVERDGRKCQFTEAVLMCFNQSEQENSQRYSLEPLGYELQVRDDTNIPAPPGAGTHDLGGRFRLFDEFSQVYERIYGELYVGKPLTQVRFNRDLRRFEQFFENVGFYRNLSDPPGQVHLISYGAFLCGQGCASRLDEYWLIQRSRQITQVFDLALHKMNREDLGRPLSQPRISGDGMVEQVYENALLYAPPDDLDHIHLRPLVLWLGFVAVQPPVEKNPHDQLIFYETENGLGHNIPLFFDAFIANHGGREQAGRPVTELFPVEEGRIYRQCFENYCLDYYPDAEENRRVRMVDLGRQYVTSVEPGLMALMRFTSDTIEIRLEEANPQLGRGESQKLILQVINRTNGQPMAWVMGRLILNLPDRPAQELDFPPTERDGKATVDLAPFDGLANMSAIEYRVCLDLPDDPQVCAVDSFIYRGE